mgnify:FL=1
MRPERKCVGSRWCFFRVNWHSELESFRFNTHYIITQEVNVRNRLFAFNTQMKHFFAHFDSDDIAKRQKIMALSVAAFIAFIFAASLSSRPTMNSALLVQAFCCILIIYYGGIYWFSYLIEWGRGLVPTQALNRKKISIPPLTFKFFQSLTRITLLLLNLIFSFGVFFSAIVTPVIVMMEVFADG